MVSSDREEFCIRTSSHIKVLGVCQGFENVPRDFVVPFVHPKGLEEWERAKARVLWDQAGRGLVTAVATVAYAALSASPPNSLYYFIFIFMFILIAIFIFILTAIFIFILIAIVFA